MQIFGLPSSLLGGAKKQQRTIFEQCNSTDQLSLKRRAMGDRADEIGVQILNVYMMGIQWSLSTRPKAQDCMDSTEIEANDC